MPKSPLMIINWCKEIFGWSNIFIKWETVYLCSWWGDTTNVWYAIYNINIIGFFLRTSQYRPLFALKKNLNERRYNIRYYLLQYNKLCYGFGKVFFFFSPDSLVVFTASCFFIIDILNFVSSVWWWSFLQSTISCYWSCFSLNQLLFLYRFIDFRLYLILY